MFRQNNLYEKLAFYGIDVSKQNPRAIQKKILELYDILEQKSTENLLLRKQNDDIKIQINTINDLFSNKEPYIKPSLYTSNNMVNMDNSFGNSTNSKNRFKYQNTVLQQQDHKNSLRTQNRLQNLQQFQNRELNNTQEFQNSQIEESLIEDNDQKCNKISHQLKQNNKSSFCNAPEKINKYESTARKNINQNSKNNNLNQKLEFLIRQNESILNRMNKMEAKFMKNKPIEKNDMPQNVKNVDDRETNFSSDITSIHNIWIRNKVGQENRTNMKRNHSTNHISSYRNNFSKQ